MSQKSENRLKNRENFIKILPFETLLANAPDKKCDLVDGQYMPHSPASFKHNELRRFLESVISMYAEEKELGIVFTENFPIKLDERNWREPDLVYVSSDRISHVQETFFDGVPNFIIEIVSEDSRYRDTVRKRAEYEQLGVEEYWIIDPDSFEESFFLQLKDNRYEEITFTEEKLTPTCLPKFYILKKWIWNTAKHPKLLDVAKMLGLT